MTGVEGNEFRVDEVPINFDLETAPAGGVSGATSATYTELRTDPTLVWTSPVQDSRHAHHQHAHYTNCDDAFSGLRFSRLLRQESPSNTV
jgi:hypothetical protein